MPRLTFRRNLRDVAPQHRGFKTAWKCKWRCGRQRARPTHNANLCMLHRFICITSPYGPPFRKNQLRALPRSLDWLLQLRSLTPSLSSCAGGPTPLRELESSVLLVFSHEPTHLDCSPTSDHNSTQQQRQSLKPNGNCRERPGERFDIQIDALFPP